MDSAEGNNQTTPGSLVVSRSPESAAMMADGEAPPMPILKSNYKFAFKGFRGVQTAQEASDPIMAALARGAWTGNAYNYFNTTSRYVQDYISVSYTGPTAVPDFCQ